MGRIPRKRHNITNDTCLTLAPRPRVTPTKDSKIESGEQGPRLGTLNIPRSDVTGKGQWKIVFFFLWTVVVNKMWMFFFSPPNHQSKPTTGRSDNGNRNQGRMMNKKKAVTRVRSGPIRAAGAPQAGPDRRIAAGTRRERRESATHPPRRPGPRSPPPPPQPRHTPSPIE